MCIITENEAASACTLKVLPLITVPIVFLTEGILCIKVNYVNNIAGGAYAEKPVFAGDPYYLIRIIPAKGSLTVCSRCF